jgi:hypothetical protein
MFSESTCSGVSKIRNQIFLRALLALQVSQHDVHNIPMAKLMAFKGVTNRRDRSATSLLIARCDGQGVNVVIGRIVIHRTRHANASKEVAGLVAASEEGHPAFGHKEDAVEHGVDL